MTLPKYKQNRCQICSRTGNFAIGDNRQRVRKKAKRKVQNSMIRVTQSVLLLKVNILFILYVQISIQKSTEKKIYIKNTNSEEIEREREKYYNENEVTKFHCSLIAA